MQMLLNVKKKREIKIFLDCVLPCSVPPVFIWDHIVSIASSLIILKVVQIKRYDGCFIVISSSLSDSAICLMEVFCLKTFKLGTDFKCL